jgi:hypothetical protein
MGSRIDLGEIILSLSGIEPWFHYRHIKKTTWTESASELCLPCDRLLSAKLVLTFADSGYRVVGSTDPYGPIL